MRLALLVLSVLAVPVAAQQSSLSPFESDAQLLTYFRELRAEQERVRRETDEAYRRSAEKLERCRKDAVTLNVRARSDTSKSAVIGGRVTNRDGDPQRSVRISIPALRLTTLSTNDGRFRLVVPAERFVLGGASQGEVRSHGFFYRMDGADSGVLGLPVHQAGRPGYRHLFDGSAGIVFLRNNARQFSPLGTLRASGKPTNDRCRVSCVDWYGNARPLFLRGRVFALLGYELVEGRIAGDSIRELQRVSYAPGNQTAAR